MKIEKENPCKSIFNRLIHSQHQTRWKNETSRNLLQPVERVDIPMIYHEWNENFQKINQRPKHLKPMVKDPYSPLKGVVNQVTRSIVTEREVSLPLISAKAIKTVEVNIRTAPRRPSRGTAATPKLVRYLRKSDLLPSEESSNVFTPNRLDIVPVQYEKSSIVMTNSTPRRTPIERLLYRDQLRNDSAILRRPPRKFIFTPSNESLVRFSILT